MGTLEAFPNGDVVPYVDLLGMEPAQLRSMGRYVLRWPGHGALWKTLVDLHLLDDEPVMLDGVAVDRKRLLADAIGPHLRYGARERDVVVVRGEARGRKDGNEAHAVYQVIDRRDLDTGYTAMSRTVGYTASIGADDRSGPDCQERRAFAGQRYSVSALRRRAEQAVSNELEQSVLGADMQHVVELLDEVAELTGLHVRVGRREEGTVDGEPDLPPRPEPPSHRRHPPEQPGWGLLRFSSTDTLHPSEMAATGWRKYSVNHRPPATCSQSHCGIAGAAGHRTTGVVGQLPPHYRHLATSPPRLCLDSPA
ncbi:MAG: hypothetical protein GY835_06535 [bacterium]|nr:hypothetical protein [bacterium]